MVSACAGFVTQGSCQPLFLQKRVRSLDRSLQRAEPRPKAAQSSKKAQVHLVLKRCRRCGEQFDPELEGGANECRYHASVIGARGFYTRVVERRARRVVGDGPPRINFKGEIIEGALGEERVIIRQEFVSRWTCCHSENVNDKGCRTGRHLTYDDEDERFEDDWPRRNGNVLGYGVGGLT